MQTDSKLETKKPVTRAVPINLGKGTVPKMGGPPGRPYSAISFSNNFMDSLFDREGKLQCPFACLSGFAVAPEISQ